MFHFLSNCLFVSLSFLFIFLVAARVRNKTTTWENSSSATHFALSTCFSLHAITIVGRTYVRSCTYPKHRTRCELPGAFLPLRSLLYTVSYPRLRVMVQLVILHPFSIDFFPSPHCCCHVEFFSFCTFGPIFGTMAWRERAYRK